MNEYGYEIDSVSGNNIGNGFGLSLGLESPAIEGEGSELGTIIGLIQALIDGSGESSESDSEFQDALLLQIDTLNTNIHDFRNEVNFFVGCVFCFAAYKLAKSFLHFFEF